MTRPRPLLAERRRDRATVPRGLRPPVPLPSTHTTSGEGLAELLGLVGLDARNTDPNETNITGLPAVQAGVDMVAHAVAAMMVSAQVFYPSGEQYDDVPNVVTRPFSLMGSFEFWTQAVDCAMKRGNWVGILTDFDRDGYARQVVPVHPDAVSLDDSTGFPMYQIGATRYRWDEIVHVRHGAPVGSLWGQGIVERYRLAAQRHLYEAEWGRTSFASGGVPSAVIQLDTPNGIISDALAEETQERWLERHTGSNRKPAIIGKAISVTPISWSPEDAEFVEARRTSVGEAALMCGLDPVDLGASIGGAGLTYANLTDRQLSRILQAFMPWTRLFEQAWSDLIPFRATVTGDVEALLRSSTKERMEVYTIAKALGLYTTEELREEERRPPLPEPETPPPPPPVTPPAAMLEQEPEEEPDE